MTFIDWFIVITVIGMIGSVLPIVIAYIKSKIEK